VVQCSPLLNQARCGPGKVTSDRAPIVDPDQCFVLGVDRMKVRRVVIGEVHVDRYPVELTQPRHPTNLRRPRTLLWSYLTRGEQGRSAITTESSVGDAAQFGGLMSYGFVRLRVRYTVGRDTENNSPRSEIVYSPV